MPRVNVRLLDAGEEHLNTLVPLCGYANKPLVSLKEATANLGDLLDNIDVRVWTATERSKNPKDNLTPDQSAAIVLYTIEWDPDHPSLYKILNETLRLEDRKKLIPWFPFLKLILTGLFTLPSIKCTIWRGVPGDYRSHYKQGDYVTWWAFSSCTTSLNVFEGSQYLGTSGPRTLFAIDCINGKDINNHSYFKTEEEILLLPCTRFQVISHLTTMEKLHIIHLREVQPPHVLLEPPAAGFALGNSNEEQLQAKINQLTNENRRLKEECAQQKIRIQKLMEENEILHENYNDYQSEIKNLNEENSGLKKEKNSFKQELKRHQEEIRSLKEEMEQCENERRRLSDQVQRVKNQTESQLRSATASNQSTMITSAKSAKTTSKSAVLTISTFLEKR